MGLAKVLCEWDYTMRPGNGTSRQATCQITENLMKTENGYVRRGSTV